MDNVIYRVQDYFERNAALAMSQRQAGRQGAAAWSAVLRPQAVRKVVDEVTFTDIVAALLEDGKPCTVLLFSIDGLADISARYGDVIGDELVAQFCGRLRRVEPLASAVARLHGDDFAMALSGYHTHDDAEAIGARFMRALDEPFLFNSGGLYISTSIGIAHARYRGPDAATLIGAAFTALRDARAVGGRTWQARNEGPAHMDDGAGALDDADGGALAASGCRPAHAARDAHGVGRVKQATMAAMAAAIPPVLLPFCAGLA
jgi:diguanylate cyclase (GGDEF)-like protein